MVLRALALWGARTATDAVRDRLGSEARAASDVLASEGVTLSLVPPPSGVDVAALLVTLARLLSAEHAPAVAARLDEAGAPATASLLRHLAGLEG